MRTKQKGFTNLLLVMFLAVLAVFIVATIQSRILLSIYRNRSQSDTIISTYHAESEIFDALAHIFGGYTITLNPPDRTLSDGTTLHITGQQVGDIQTIDVTAKLPYAVTKIEAIRNSSTTTTTGKADIILSLDCTGSMVENTACPSCIQTRLWEEKLASQHLVDLLRTAGVDVRFGLSVFGLNPAWAKTSTNQVITPENNVSLDEIWQTIEHGFILNTNGSYDGSTAMADMPLCQEVLQSTNIGSAFGFSHDYFAAHTDPTRKQVEIVISDGVPNASLPYSPCPGSMICPPYATSQACSQFGGCITPYSHYTESFCIPYGRSLLSCALATPDKGGVRNSNIDAYMITVLDGVNPIDENIFQSYATKYYNSGDARDLSGFIDQVFGELTTTLNSLIIKRVIP
jgi:hypothetical protein